MRAFSIVHLTIAIGSAACAAYVVYSALHPVVMALQSALSIIH